MSLEEVLNFLDGFEFWKIEKSSTGRISITVGPCKQCKGFGKRYLILYSRKNETVAELCVRLKVRVNEVVKNAN